MIRIHPTGDAPPPASALADGLRNAYPDLLVRLDLGSDSDHPPAEAPAALKELDRWVELPTDLGAEQGCRSPTVDELEALLVEMEGYLSDILRTQMMLPALAGESFRQAGFDRAPLAGFRLGLSGAVPDRADWHGRALDREILRFVSALSDGLFRHGGELVHGTHPSFTPILLGQARPYSAQRGQPLVTLVRSRLWPDDALRRDIAVQASQGAVRLIETDPVPDPAKGIADPNNAESLKLSLMAMPGRLIQGIDALVVIGGKRHAGSGSKPGTQEELDAALARRLPCFLLGGFGGMAEDLAADPAYRDRLGNGLSREDNDYLLATRNYGAAVAIIVETMIRLRRERLAPSPSP